MTIINNRRNVIVPDEDGDYDAGEAVAISDDSENYGRTRSNTAVADDGDYEDERAEEDDVNVAVVIVDDPDSTEDEWQIRRAAAVRTVLPELDGPSARDMEREERDWADVDTSEGTDALDDPVRMYLREIGRVDLLTSADERRLARELEGLNHLRKFDGMTYLSKLDNPEEIEKALDGQPLLEPRDTCRKVAARLANGFKVDYLPVPSAKSSWTTPSGKPPCCCWPGSPTRPRWFAPSPAISNSTRPCRWTRSRIPRRCEKPSTPRCPRK